MAMPDYGTEESESGLGGGGWPSGGAPNYTPPELTAEWGEVQPDGSVNVYQRYSDGQTILSRTESLGQNQAAWAQSTPQYAPQGTPQGTPLYPGGGYQTIRDPSDIIPWWNEWLASGGSGDPNAFIQHYQSLFGQTPDSGVIAGLAAGRQAGPTKTGPTIKLDQPKIPLAANQLEALMAQMAAQFGLQRSQGGFKDWMSLAQAPFQMGTQRSQLLNQLAGTMGWMPYQPQKFGVPEVPQMTPPDWLNKWISSGYVGG